MTHLQKLRLYPFLRWVSANMFLNPLNSFQYPCHSVNNYYRLCGSVAQNAFVDGNNGEIRRRVSPTMKKEAESALLDYLYCTRSFCYLDAEHMSKNSPHFLRKLVEKVGYEPDVRRSLTRFLRYHPINEFEPFFESIGLEPFEFEPLLPSDSLFLSDDDDLLDNYHVLCEYGFQRDKIGKIVREVRVVFRWNREALRAKLEAFQELGVDRDVVVKAISFNPDLLICGMSKEFFEVVKRLKYFGYEYDWIEQRLVESACYNWRQLDQMLYLLDDLGCKSEEIRKLIGRHPEVLFDQSGRSTFSLIGFLLKVGCPKNDICSMFSQFPRVKVRKFVWNLRRVCELFFDIKMDVATVGRIIRSHFTWLGSCSLKKAHTLRNHFNTGNKNLCDIIITDPLELKKWTLRSKIERWPESRETRKIRIRRENVKFLLSIGFTENSSRIDKALKLLRVKGKQLHERFNFLIQAGLSEDDASKLIKAAPQILNQSIDVLEAKISLLVNDLGYPLYSLKPFPGFMCYTMERVKLRCAMYKWLTDQKVVRPRMTLSTVIGCAESVFINKYASKHPRGPKVWQEFKQSFSTENSSRMDKALKVFHDKGEELHERFNCLVKAGLSEDDASKLIKATPRILNQSIDVLEAKISLLVNDLGYPVYSLKPFPRLMCFTLERVKLRSAMYKWLTDEKVVRPKMPLSTVFGCTELVFINKYASKHPRGLEVWQEFKQSFSTENSSRMEKDLKVLRGKGEELHERLNCLIKAGLNEDDASKLIKAAPKILNQSIGVLEAKISLLVNDLGYPVYSLKSFPRLLCFTMERVKLRCAMYKWLTDQKVVRPTMALSTVIGCKESVFINKYATKHPRGPEVWQEFKQSFSTG